VFVGGLPKYCLDYLKTEARALEGSTLVVGCSGSYGIERALAGVRLAGVFSNDISLYSCALGWWLSGEVVSVKVSAEAPPWVSDAWGDGARAFACLDVLTEALPFEKQANAHQRRMWSQYARHFAQMVEEREKSLDQWPKRLVTRFWAGDVFDHFEAHDTQQSVFVCFAPTYGDNYARMYARLEAMFEWAAPPYVPLDSDRRAELLHWMAQRRFLWFDDRVLDGMKPIMIFRRGAMHDIYLYGNALQHQAYIDPPRARQKQKLLLASDDLELTERTRIEVVEISVTELATYKDMFLNKNIDHKPGSWGFAVTADGLAIGFFEYSPGQAFGAKDEVYLQSDFPVAGTKYARLSKLIVTIATCGTVCKILERKRELRTRTVVTTAFTDKPISMKYRGVLKVTKRGEKNGKKYINYETQFRNDTPQEVFLQWILRNSQKSSSNSTSNSEM
jgi:hypothetical protein